MSSHNQFTIFLSGLEPSTRRAYGLHLSQFDRWHVTQYSEPAGDVSALTVRAYRDHLIGLGRAANTINAHLSAIRSWAAFCGHSIDVAPVKRQRPPVSVPTDIEVNRLLRAMDKPSHIAIVSLMARAGLRVGEVVALRFDAVSINARSGSVMIRQGKGLKSRVVPLSLAAREAVSDYLKSPDAPAGGLLFRNSHSGPLTARAVQIKLARVSQQIRAHITPHQLRHYFATKFLQGGGDLATLSMLLGHSSTATTSTYLHPNVLQVQAMVEHL